MAGHSLNDPKRLQALAETQLMDSPPEESFDQLARLVQRFLNVPVSLVSLVDDQRQFFKAAVGLAGEVANQRGTPLTHSLCQHVVTRGEALAVIDSVSDPLTRTTPPPDGLGIGSYLGYPIVSPDGYTLGSMCAIDSAPRNWTDDDHALMREFAQLVNERIELQVARQRIADTESRFVKIAQHLPGAIFQFLMRPDGTFCVPYASEGLKIIYGISPEDVRDDAGEIFAAIHPHDLEGLEKSILSSAETLSSWHHEYRACLPDGSVQWLSGNANPERLSDGSTRWHGYISLVTERKEQEARYRASMERFRTSFDNAGIGMATLDPSGQWITANPALLAMFGYTLEEMQQLTFQDLTHPEDHHIGRDLAPRMLSGEIKVGRATKRYRRKDGDYIWCQLTTALVRDEDGQPREFVSQLADITAVRTAEEERIRMDKKLADTAKLESLGVLAGGIAHDFNNLLTGVLGNASLMKFDLPPHSAHYEAVEQIDSAARRAADLCRQMLAYSGKGRFLVHEIDLNTVITDTTRLLEVSINKQTTLRFHLAPQLPTIEADETQVRQIVMNLVINGSEAIGDRPGIVGIATGITRLNAEDTSASPFNDKIKPGAYVWLEISDNGEGMEPDVVEKIFDPFFTTKFTGRGLGLAAVQGIMRGHGGAIKVYSEIGKGTTFRLLFPSTANPADVAGPTDHGDHDPNMTGTVLIVDDDESVRKVASRILNYFGFDIETAVDGAMGVQKFRRNPRDYAFVLLDLTMPHLDGAETFREMRHLDPNVKVILMSGFNSQEIITRFAGRGLAGFVPKPLDSETLMNAVKALFADPTDESSAGAHAPDQ
jgi:PAS domain S-box-containing protein